jgi:hypothetical protein
MKDEETRRAAEQETLAAMTRLGTARSFSVAGAVMTDNPAIGGTAKPSSRNV